MAQRLVCDPTSKQSKRRFIYVHGSAGSGKTTYAKSLGNDLAYLDSWSIPLSAADKKIIVFDDNCLATNVNMTELIGLTGNVPYRVVSETGHGAPLKAETIVIISQHPPSRFMTGWLIPKNQINQLKNNIDEIVDVDAFKARRIARAAERRKPQQVEDLQRRILQLKKQHDELLAAELKEEASSDVLADDYFNLVEERESIEEKIKQALDTLEGREASAASSSATILSTQETTSAAAKTSSVPTLCSGDDRQVETLRLQILQLELKASLQEKVSVINNDLVLIRTAEDRQLKFDMIKSLSRKVIGFFKNMRLSNQQAKLHLNRLDATILTLYTLTGEFDNESVRTVREGVLLYIENEVCFVAKSLAYFFEAEIESLTKGDQNISATSPAAATSTPNASLPIPKTSSAATLCGQQAETLEHRTLMLKDCLQEKIDTIKNSVKWIGLTKDRQHKFEHMKDSSQVIADFAKVLKTPSDQEAARDLGWIEGTAFAILFAMQTLGEENVCKVREGFILYLESRVLNCAKSLIDFFEKQIVSLSKSEMATQTKEVTSSLTAEINTQDKAAGVTVTKATTAAKEALPIPKPPQAGLDTARSKDDLIEQIKEAISGMVIDAKILVASK